MNITAITEDESTVRISLPAEPVWSGNDETSTGIFRKAIYVSPRAKRCVVETYSIWQDRTTNGCVGTRYFLIESEDTLNHLAGEYPKVAAALEKAGMVNAEAL